MSNMNRFRCTILVLLLFTSLACGVSLNNDNKDADVEELQLQITLQALQLTQSADSGSQNHGPQPQPPQDNTAPQADNSSSAEEEEEDDGIPCNDSHIIYETIKDGTVYKPGETFEKSWTLRNEGDCDWTTSYKFKFIEGTRMDGASSITVPSVIEPNEDITFKVNLTAPDTAGDYTGVWQLFSDDNEEMGRYWVKITVGTTAPPAAPPAGSFSVTSVKLYFTQDGGTDNVCADIAASSAGEVTYKWVDKDTNDEIPGAVIFNAAGTKTVCELDIIMCPGCGAKLYIDNPNHQWFGPILVP